MAEPELSFAPVVCGECGLKTKISVRASGTEDVIPAIAMMCEHQPPDHCPSLKAAFLRAHESIRRVQESRQDAGK